MLFNLSAFCLFVSVTFVHLSKLAMELVSKSLNLTLLIGEVVVSSDMSSRCPLVLCRHVPKVDLVVFNLLGFDIILDIDWLSQHYTCINFHSWMVSF